MNLYQMLININYVDLYNTMESSCKVRPRKIMLSLQNYKILFKQTYFNLLR